VVLAFSAICASIWGSHIETPYKKQQLKKAMPFAFYGGPWPASRALPAAAAPCSLLAVLLLHDMSTDFFLRGVSDVL
jgi:hypothetical protein